VNDAHSSEGEEGVYVSYSPRNKSAISEGSWEEWAHLAAAILADRRSQDAFPELHAAAKKALSPKGRKRLS
jgi:hypothetical protein